MARRRKAPEGDEGEALQDGAELESLDGDREGEGAEPPPEPRKAWRTVAFVMKARSVYLDGGLVQLLGGEFVTHPQHVERVKSDPAFRLVEVGSAAELAELQADYAAEVARVRAAAAELGLVVFRDGEVDPPKKRR